MVPNKVIHIRDARRRVAKAKKKQRAPRKPGLLQRISQWLTHGTTRGTVLLAGVVAGLVMGAVVATVLTAPAASTLEQQVEMQP
ncbi:MAG TPA: hypothetical protein VD969_21695 [Symbiobacteriaceae bacterium]|nr:hypothetical protein [Symbiobacteriaceae bacterium]